MFIYLGEVQTIAGHFSGGTCSLPKIYWGQEFADEGLKIERPLPLDIFASFYKSLYQDVKSEEDPQGVQDVSIVSLQSIQIDGELQSDQAELCAHDNVIQGVQDVSCVQIEIMPQGDQCEELQSEEQVGWGE